MLFSVIVKAEIYTGGVTMTEEELRCHAIERYLNGEQPKTIYEDIGRTKPWFFKWVKRYQSGEPQWYLSQPRIPLNKPTRINEVERLQVIHIREQLERHSFAQIGVSAIKWELHKAGLNIPSDRTINRILKREGLVKKNLLHPKRG